MRTIEQDELELLATGAWILGAGGGGNPYLAYLNLEDLPLAYLAGDRLRVRVRVRVVGDSAAPSL